MSKGKFFQKYVKSQGQGHEVKNFGTERKVLQYECFISFSSKVIAKVKFTLDKQTDRKTKRVIPIYPPNFVCGGGLLWYHVKGLVARNTHV